MPDEFRFGNPKLNSDLVDEHCCIGRNNQHFRSEAGMSQAKMAFSNGSTFSVESESILSHLSLSIHLRRSEGFPVKG